MNKRRTPKHEYIVNAQVQLLEQLGIPLHIADRTCWACRKEFVSSKPERAHILPHSKGHGDLVDNFLLLCGTCHKNQPDGQDRKYQLEWLEKYPPFWQHPEFDMRPLETEFFRMSGINLQDFVNLLMDRFGTQGMINLFRRTLKEGSLEKAGLATGNARANAVAALVILYRTTFCPLE